MKKSCALLVLFLLWITPIVSQAKTDKDRDGLIGPVKRVENSIIDFVTKDNRIVEEKRRNRVASKIRTTRLEEVSTVRGSGWSTNRIQNQYEYHTLNHPLPRTVLTASKCECCSQATIASKCQYCS